MILKEADSNIDWKNKYTIVYDESWKLYRAYEFGKIMGINCKDKETVIRHVEIYKMVDELYFEIRFYHCEKFSKWLCDLIKDKALRIEFWKDDLSMINLKKLVKIIIDSKEKGGK